MNNSQTEPILMKDYGRCCENRYPPAKRAEKNKPALKGSDPFGPPALGQLCSVEIQASERTALVPEEFALEQP